MTRLACALTIAWLGWAKAEAADVLPDIPKGTISVRLNPLVTGLGAPDYAISAPGDLGRLFVVEQKGTLLVVQNGSLLPTPALDLQSRISTSLNPASANDERGFLGLAFHPGFSDATSAGYRTLYTFSSEPIPTGTSPTYVAPNNATQNYRTVVAEWKMSTSNPNVVDPSSRREIISFGKNASNHNGGTITFGKDGYLYLGLGDGGNANDVGASHIEPGGNAQNLSTPLGKMLRIDPLNPALTSGSADPASANGQYRIPTSNPFQNPGQAPEIYAYGFRNPYRFSVDRLTGEIIVADVGQNNVEEIDRLQSGGNYGWSVKEGTFTFDRATGTVTANSPGSPAGLIDPITGTLGTLEYDHGDGISITGGFVYRGTLIPELDGKYVFGDLALRNAPPRVDGRLFYADLVTGEIKELLLPQFPDGKLPDGLTVHGFGEDAAGELYALVTNTPANGSGGILFQIAAVPEPETWAMFGVGMLLLAGRLRHRSQRSRAFA
jgi:glucose/arabinose dehydrogenase